MEDFLFLDMHFYYPMIVFGGHDVEQVKRDFLNKNNMITICTIKDKEHQLYKECNEYKPPEIKDDIAAVIICCSYNKSFET